MRVLQGREISGPLQRRQAVPTCLYSKQQLFSRTLGHLSAVYCLLFDRSGQYVITVSVHTTAVFKSVQVVTVQGADLSSRCREKHAVPVSAISAYGRGMGLFRLFSTMAQLW